MPDGINKQQRSIYAGCDLGIRSAKVVITENGTILGSDIVFYKSFPHRAAEAAMEGALRKAGISGERVVRCLATGFGDKAVRYAERSVSNVTSLLRGLRAVNQKVRTVVDVGGHTLRVYSIGNNGDLSEMGFVESCTAATGMFLEVMAKALEITNDELAASSLTSDDPVMISNTCVIFAESEVISRINEGYGREAVFAGVIHGVAAKIASITRRIDTLVPEVAMTGGVVKYSVVKKEVERQLGLKFAELGGVDPQIIAAFGAALLAEEGAFTGNIPKVDVR